MTESLYKSIAEESNDGIFVAKDGEVIYANEELANLTGQPTETLVGSSKTSFVAAEDKDLVENYHHARIEGEDAPNQYEVALETPEGEQVPVELSVSRGTHEGEPVSISFCRDITSQKQRERTLEQLKHEYKSMFDNVEDTLFLLDVESDEALRFQRINEHGAQFAEDSPDEIHGQTPVEAFGDEVGRRVTEHARMCLQSGETVTYEESVESDGEPRYWEIKLTPLIDGNVRKIIGVCHEQTELCSQRRQLEKSTERLQVLFDEAPDAMVIHDGEGNILDTNKRNVENLGYSRDELTSMNVTDYEVGVDIEEARALWNEMDVGETVRIEGEHERKDGTTYPVEVWLSKIEVHGNPQYLAMGRDISARIERERELQQFREAVERTGHAVYITDTEGTIEYVNPAFEELTGYSKDEAIGQNPRILKSDEYDEAYYEGMWDSLLSNEQWEDDILDERNDGEEIFLHQSISPIATDGGQPQKFVAVAHDVTQRKEYEQLLERQRDNLELLNQMFRHDIRNNLQIISTYAETIEATVEEETRSYVEKLIEAAGTAEELTETARDVTAVMLQTDADRVPTDLRFALESEIDAARSNYTTPLVTVDGSIPRVEVLADEMLGSVFRNLLSNAIQHNEEEIPEVTVSATALAETVDVRIADNGRGIPKERRESIFEEGERGLDSQGSGLGLYLVKTLVDRYEGAIHVEENEPEGSVFVVRLPLAS